VVKRSEMSEKEFGVCVFRLACAYGLAKTAPERKRGEMVMWRDEDNTPRHPNWLWNRARQRWRSETE